MKACTRTESHKWLQKSSFIKKQKIPENILITNKKHKKDGNSLQKNSTKKYNIKKSFFK